MIFEPVGPTSVPFIPFHSFLLENHLSYPAGSSVNDGIPKELATVRYATIDDAIRLIKSLGKGCFLANYPRIPQRFSVARNGMAGKVLF